MQGRQGYLPCVAIRICRAVKIAPWEFADGISLGQRNATVYQDTMRRWWYIADGDRERAPVFAVAPLVAEAHAAASGDELGVHGKASDSRCIFSEICNIVLPVSVHNKYACPVLSRRQPAPQGSRRKQWKDYRPVQRRFRRELPSPVPEHPRDSELTPERQYTFRQILARRVASLTVVLDGCHDPHNATAVIRSCEAMGLQHVHVITDRVSFKINRRIAQGAQFYTTIHVHASVEDCYAWLRREGYRIVVTDLAEDGDGPERLPPYRATPIALVFGSEGFGVSEAASAKADQAMLIPMAGMVQSLNLSVSVAIAVHAVRAADLSADSAGDLSAEQQIALYDQWVARGRRPVCMMNEPTLMQRHPERREKK